MTELEREEALIDRTSIALYQPIVLPELVQRFAPKLDGKIPGFVFNYLKKILHLDEVNDILSQNHECTGQQFLDNVCTSLDIHVKFNGVGMDEIATLTNRPMMFVSNHPYGGPEGIILFSKIHRMFPKSRLLIQSFLKFIRPLSEVCVYNKKDVSTLKTAVDDGRPLLIYPAGYCSRQLSFGDVFDYDWKPSFIKIAKRNNMPIAVFFTDGRLSKRTLRWTKFRNIFHIKTSVETAFLPDEIFRLRGKEMTFTVGHVIYPELLDDSVSNEEWAARLRQYCYELKTNPNAVFDPAKPAVLPLK